MVFPGGVLLKYYPGPMLLNFGDQTRTSAFNMVWQLAVMSIIFVYLFVDKYETWIDKNITTNLPIPYNILKAFETTQQAPRYFLIRSSKAFLGQILQFICKPLDIFW